MVALRDALGFLSLLDFCRENVLKSGLLLVVVNRLFVWCNIFGLQREKITYRCDTLLQVEVPVTVEGLTI